jgi:peptide/nickel transport system substrate-binding protein
VRAASAAARKRIAEAAQVRALEIGTHAPLGEYLQPVAARRDITGYLNAPVYLYWNLDRK